jgi:DNA-binding MarR family transcriptional regulator
MTPGSRIADDVDPAAPSHPEPSSATTTEPADGDLAADLSLLMGTLIRMLRREAPTPVGPGSLAALATLSRSGPMRLGDLALREGVAPPTLTRMIAGLEEAGYVSRRPDPGDRRAVRVSLTDEGAQVVAAATAARADVFRMRIAALPDDARRALADAVPALRALAGEPPAERSADRP